MTRYFTLLIRRYGLLVALFAMLVLITRDARAVDVTWAGASNGNWSAGANWSGGVVPNNGANTYFVAINNAAGQYMNVNQDLTNATIAKLTMSSLASVTIPTGKTLQLANPSAGVPALLGGTTNLAGTLRLAGTGATLTTQGQISFNGGSILGNGILENKHSLYGSGVIGNNGTNGTHDLRINNIGTSTTSWYAISATSHTTPLILGPTATPPAGSYGIWNSYASLVANNGTLVLRGPSTIYNASGGKITSYGTGVVRLTNGIDVQFQSSSSGTEFSGTGKIQVPAGESATIRNAVINAAQFESLGTLTIAGNITNSSILSVGGSVLPHASGVSVTNTGTIRGLSEAAAFDVGAGSITNETNGIIEGAGVIKARTITSNAGSIRSNLPGQTLTVLTTNGIFSGDPRATNGSTLRIGTATPTPGYNGNFTAGSVTVDAGSSMYLHVPSMYFGSYTNNGTLGFTSTSTGIGGITGTGSTSFSGTGSRSVATLRQAGLSVENVTLWNSSSGIWRTSALSLAGNGKLALSSAPFVLDHGSNSPISQIRSWMAAGQFTSQNANEVVGYVEASDIGSPTSWLGESNIDPTTLLFRSTFAGDTNLDRVVNFNDLLKLAQHYGSTSAYWSRGDFDHDGAVGFNDLLLLAQKYTAPTPVTLPDDSAFATDWLLARSLVPEPASLCFMLIPILPRRRRSAAR